MATQARITLSAEDKTRAAFESVGQGLQGLKVNAVAVTSVLGTLGVTAAALTFASSIKGAIDQADSLNKLSQRTGIAAESLSQLQFAAKLSDVSTESLTAGIKKLNVSISEGLAGDKEKVAMFKALGVTLTDATGKAKSADQVLMQMADTFSTARDGAGKTALAVGLLGKAGDEMIPLLNGGSGAIKDMMEKAQKLGLTISTEFAKQSEEFNDNLTILRTSSDRLAVSLAGGLVGSLGKVARAMADASIEGGKFRGIIAGLAEAANQVTGGGGKGFFETKALAGLGSRLTTTAAEVERLRDGIASGKLTGEIWTQQLKMQSETLEKLRAQFRVADAEFRGLGALPTGDFSRMDRSKPLAKVDLREPPKGGGDATLKSANKELAEQAKLLAELAGLSGSFADDWDRLNKIYAAGKINVDELAAAQAALLAKQPVSIKEQKLAADGAKGLTESWAEQKRVVDELLKSRDKLYEVDKTAHKSAADLVKSAQIELEMLGKTNAEREVAIALRQLEATGVERGTLAYAAYAQALQFAIIDRAEMQRQIDDFDRLWTSMDSTARDTFRGIGDGWEGVVKRMRDTLKNTLLDYLYQAAVRPVLFNLVASVSGAKGTAVSTVGQAAGLLGGGGGSGLLGTIQGGADILNTGGIAGVGYGIGNTAGTALANLTGTGIDGLLATNGAFGTAGGAMGALGTALPYIGAALAVISLLDSGKKGGPKDIGSFGSGFLGEDSVRVDSGAEFNAGAANIVGGINSSYAGAARSLGIKTGDLQSAAMFAIDNKGEGDALTALTTQSYLNGKLVYDRNDAASGSDAYKDVGRTPEELQAAITLASARAVLSALKASELPAQLADYFGALDPLAMSAEQITAALDLAKAAQQFSTQLGFMGEGLAHLAGLSVKATTDLAAAAGGMDQLQTSFAAYYQIFYTEQERAAASLASVTQAMADLGYGGVDTAAGFRALVESIDPVDDASRNLLSSLLALAPAFASAHVGAQSLTAAAAAFFQGVDALAMVGDLTADATSGIDKFLGTTLQSVTDAQAASAQASINAARDAAALWGQAHSSIKAALDDMRGVTAAMAGPGVRRSGALASLDKATLAALGGDADAASSVGDLARQFLAASEAGSVDRISYLRDRAMADIKLSGVLDKAKTQITLQEAIASAGESTVAQLQIANQTLSGFGATVYEMLSKGYAGAGRDTAASAANSLAKATSDFAYWFSTTQEGDVATGGNFGSAKFTRLGDDLASFTSASGSISYLRATDSILDAAKRDPALRAIWEAQYGIKLPSFAVGTPYVPYDMVAQIHQGEAIMPAPVAQRWRDSGGAGAMQSGASGNADVPALLRAIEGRLAQIEAGTTAVAVHASGTRKNTQEMLDRGLQVDQTRAPTINVKVVA